VRVFGDDIIRSIIRNPEYTKLFWKNLKL